MKKINEALIAKNQQIVGLKLINLPVALHNDIFHWYYIS